MGPVASANSDSGLSEARDKFLTRCAEKGPVALWGGTPSNVQSPLALASLVLGPCGPLLGLFKSRSETLGIWDGQHETHFVRGGPIRANCLLPARVGVLFRRQVRWTQWAANVALQRWEIAKCRENPLDPVLGVAPIRITVCQQRGDS